MSLTPRARKGTWGILGPSFLALGLTILLGGASSVYARDAAFLDPGSSTANASDEAVKVEPKPDMDTGESALNVSKRVDLFFVNETNLPVQVEKVTTTGDGNVTTEIANDDCSKQGTLAPQSRCSIEVSVTPTSGGSWNAEVLMTHNGLGRIARAHLTGKTTGTTATVERKDTGLALNTKEATPVSFGDVEVGSGKAVRSALMVNDSPDPITLYSIDVIEADNGLVRLDQGCAIDMELKPGESCPVTLVWTPTQNGQISTDLIIRHSGRLGFAVIPIRGIAKGGAVENVSGTKAGTSTGKETSLPTPPTQDELAKETAGKIPAISSVALSGDASSLSASGHFTLIGTVGNRAVLLKPDGETAVVESGDQIDVMGKQAKVVAISPKTADLVYDGKKISLTLASSPELVAKASAKSRADKAGGNSFSVSSSSAPAAPSNSASVPGAMAPAPPSSGASTGGTR